jgi:hypothetical protein
MISHGLLTMVVIIISNSPTYICGTEAELE